MVRIFSGFCFGIIIEEKKKNGFLVHLLWRDNVQLCIISLLVWSLSP
jgi:hypothetical protein